MASEKIQNILEEIKALSLLEANELKNAICEEFGVSADAPVMVAGGAAAPAAEATKDSWDVILTSAGQTKMAVIKVASSQWQYLPSTVWDVLFVLRLALLTTILSSALLSR